jgi:nucleoside-diphosphate-sugar epimerase
MIILMESNVTAERFVLNSENLSLREFFVKAAEILGKPAPRFVLNGTMLSLLAIADELRGRITGSRPVITRENVRAALSKSNYSAAKFSSGFNYSFIPIAESLKEAFRILEALKK